MFHLCKTPNRLICGSGFLCFVSCLLLSLASAQAQPDNPLLRRPPNTLLEYKQSEYDRYQHQLEYESQHHAVNTDNAFTVLGRWAWGPCRAVEITGNYALVGQGYVYQVFDISNPSAPTIVYDTTLAEPITHLEIKDSILFIVQRGTVLLADAMHPFPIVEKGRLTQFGGAGATDMAVSDTILYLLVDFRGLLAYSIADLRNPYYLARFSIIDNFTWSIAARGNFVYYQPIMAQGTTYILEYMPQTRSFRYRDLFMYAARSSLVADTLWYVGTGIAQLRIYNISNPWEPQLVSTLAVPSTIERLAKQGERLYGASQDSGMFVINVANVAQPILVNRVRDTTDGIYFGLAASTTRIAAAYNVGLNSYSIVSPDSIQGGSLFFTGGYPSAITMRGNIGFVSCGFSVWSIDFSNPARPRPVESYPWAIGSPIAMAGNLAFATAYEHGAVIFLVLRVLDGGRLSLLSRTPFDAGAQSIVVRDSLVCIGTVDSVAIFSVANPLRPRRLGMWTASNLGTTHLSILGNYLYVAQWGPLANEGLFILDISIPSNPIQVARLFSQSYSVLALDSIAYASCSFANDPGTKVAVINISNPQQPLIVDTVGAPASYVIVRSGKYLYLAINAVHVVDIMNPLHPRFVATYYDELLYNARRLDVVGNTVLLAAPFSGVWVVRHNTTTEVKEIDSRQPGTISLHQNYPNPFNSSTRINYELPDRAQVRLEIFDILGRKIRTLVDEVKDAGTHSTTWENREVSSGVYFYRLAGSTKIITKKMIVIR